MKIAIAQINCTLGDMSGNVIKIRNAVQQAKQEGAELVITPELALSGYPPADLLLREAFCRANQEALIELTQSIDDITLIVGHPDFQEGHLFNAASVIRNKTILHTYHKRVLNQSTFFNESYYFDAGSDPCVFELAGMQLGVCICSDFWHGHASMQTHYPACDLLIVLSASSYQIHKQVLRYQITRQFVQHTGIPVVHANLVGGQDEFVFEGASFVMNRQGELTHQLDELTEAVVSIEIQQGQPIKGYVAPTRSTVASIYQALCQGVKDYVQKNGFPGALIGLSGGVDSALTLAIAVDALGADSVKTVMMPSRYTANISLQDANEMAQLLGVKHDICSIQPLFEHYLSTIETAFQISPATKEADTMPENLQARIRGALLMALSNHTGLIVLTTGNKSEMAVGYCTLYGDMAGGFAVLKDVSKTWVYQLCAYRNQINPVIPERILQRAPSAELRPNQTDQDSLPPYDILDAIIEAYVEKNFSADEIIAMHYPPDDVLRVIRLIHKNEYKRRQSPPCIRITRCDFGKAWQYPVTCADEAWSPIISGS